MNNERFAAFWSKINSVMKIRSKVSALIAIFTFGVAVSCNPYLKLSLDSLVPSVDYSRESNL